MSHFFWGRERVNLPSWRPLLKAHSQNHLVLREKSGLHASYLPLLCDSTGLVLVRHPKPPKSLDFFWSTVLEQVMAIATLAACFDNPLVPQP